MTDFVARIAKSALGPDRYLPVPRPSMGGEDFAYYLEKVPGCFFLVGVEPLDRAVHPSLHTDTYDFTDGALETGIRMFCSIVNGYGGYIRMTKFEALNQGRNSNNE
jgi:metal-dependent amidase/aminoacylase/carboxypeptidase family protein